MGRDLLSSIHHSLHIQQQETIHNIPQRKESLEEE